jgi:hypothetical protein
MIDKNQYDPEDHINELLHQIITRAFYEVHSICEKKK